LTIHNLESPSNNAEAETKDFEELIQCGAIISRRNFHVKKILEHINPLSTNQKFLRKKEKNVGDES